MRPGTESESCSAWTRPRSPKHNNCERLEAEALAGAGMQLLCGTRKSIFEHVADRLPRPAIELHQSQFLDRLKIPTPGAYPDPRQQKRGLVVLERRRLPHDVFARQVITAPLEYLDQRLGGRIAVK